MATFERFTDRARRVLSLANQEAQRTQGAQGAQVTPEHILVAFLAEARGVGALLLQNLKVDLAGAREAAERLVAPDGKRTGRASDAIQLPLSSDAMQLVALPPESPRGGVLTQGTVLAVTSNPDRTSPVKRGLFILENLLGTPPPPPPPDIPPLEEAGKAFAPFVGISVSPGVASNVDVSKVKMWKMKKPLDAEAFKREWASKYER